MPLAAIGALAFTGTTAVAADMCPNAEYRTGPSAKLPDCRAYEQVSPLNKNGLGVRIGTNPLSAWASETGDVLTYFTAGAVNTENSARSWPSVQRAERGTSRWGNEQAVNGPNPDSPIHAASSLARQVTPSADGSRLLFTSGNGYTPDNPFIEAGGNGSVTLSDGETNWWVSKPTWAGTVPAPGEADLDFEQFMSLGGSPDLSTAYFQSRALLTEADGVSGRTPLESWAVYRWTDGGIENAGLLPDGTLDPDGSAAAGIVTDPSQGSSSLGLKGANVNSYTNYISSDGQSLLFVSPNPFGSSGRPAQLYVNRDGEQSELLSKRPQETDPPAGSAGLMPAGALSSHRNFVWVAPYAVASRDHTYVVFATADALTVGAPVDSSIKTYRLDREAGALTYMPDLDRSAGTRPGNVYGISDDGARILYRTQAGSLKLWRDGQPTIALAASGVSDNEIIDVRQTEDGRTWFVVATGPLGGEPDHPAGLSGQIYRYSEGSADLACISCPAQSLSPRGPATFDLEGLANGITSGGQWGALAPNRGISADGRTAFFTSTSPLSPDDHNAVADVYEWREGRLALLSSGAPHSIGDMFLDNDPTGNSVFFTSLNQLAPSDTDGLGDVYVARVGGGQPPPDNSRPTCDGDACQDSAAAPPASPSISSAASVGDGNVSSPRDRVRATLRVKRRVAARGPIGRLRVRVPNAGRVLVAGPQLRRAGRSVSKAGTYSVKVALKPRVRKRLRRSNRQALRVNARVLYRVEGGRSATQRVKIIFRQPNADRGANKKGDR